MLLLSLANGKLAAEASLLLRAGAAALGPNLSCHSMH